LIQRKIERFFQDEEGHWVAEMECGHTQHMRHIPPWQNRPWVTSEQGREARLGTRLKCKECSEGMDQEV
jgi:hypothetical protein